MPGRPGRLGFKGVPGPLGEKGKSILPPDEWKFKVYLYGRETTVQPKHLLAMYKFIVIKITKNTENGLLRVYNLR